MTTTPRTIGALSIYKVPSSDTSGPAFCPVTGCFGMALHRVEMAGYPAGFLCGKCAKEALRTWAGLIEDEPEAVAA